MSEPTIHTEQRRVAAFLADAMLADLRDTLSMSG